jgi:hypothetical protein
MQAGDTVVITRYGKVLAGGTLEISDQVTYIGVQPKPLIHFLPVTVPQELKYTLTQTAGTNETYPYQFYVDGASGGGGGTMQIYANDTLVGSSNIIDFTQQGHLSIHPSTNNLGHGEVDLQFEAISSAGFVDTWDNTRTAGQQQYLEGLCAWAIKAVTDTNWNGIALIQLRASDNSWQTICTISAASHVYVCTTIASLDVASSDMTKNLKIPFEFQTIITTPATLGTCQIRCVYQDSNDSGIPPG